MRKIDDEHKNKIREYLIKEYYGNEFNKFLGFEYLELNENYSKAKMVYKSSLLNSYGTFHGGALLAFVDAVAGSTASMCGYFVTTVSANLNFLLPAADNECIFCECMKLKTGKHILVYDIRITDTKGNLLDSGEFSFFASKTKVPEA